MPDKKLPISEFAAKIKSKYPQYGNLSDTDLVTKITNTYPKYKDMVDLSGISKKKELSEPVSPVGGETGISVPPSGFEELKPAKRQPTEVIKEPKVVGEDTLLARKMEREQRPVVSTTGVKLPAAPKVVAEEKAAERALAPKLPTAPKEDIGELEGLSNAIDRGILQGKLADMLALGQMPKREDIKEIARINKELTQIPSTGAYQRFNAAPDLKTAAKEFVDNPFEITSQLISESLSALVRHGYSRALAGAGTGAALGSLIPIPGISTAAGAGTGYIAGMGVAGYNLEMASSIMDSFREAGVDVTDEKSLTKAFDDPNTLRKAREFANKRAVPIAIFDMFSAGMGGKLLGKPAKTILSKVGRGAAEVGIQMGMAGAGETAAQLTAGQKINPTAILAEVIGEAGGGAPDIIVGTMIENKKNNQSIRKEAVRLDIEPQQLQDMLDISEASGEITDAQANEIKKEYEDIQKVKQAVPEEFKKNADVIEALNQKRQLEAKKQGLDPVFAKKIDDQIKALDTKIDDIVAAGEVAPEAAPEVPAAEEKTYRVEYFDPESRKMTHQMFATEAEGEAFKKTLTREQTSQGVTSYFEKAPAKGVGEVALEAAPEVPAAPVQELKEGQQIQFNLPANQGQKTGTKVTVPGYEDVDFVAVQDGFNYDIYELASGLKVTPTTSFSVDDAISQTAVTLASKGVTSEKLLSKIYNSEKAIKSLKINESPAIEKFKEKRIAEEEKVPFIHTEEERQKLFEIAKEAKEKGLSSAENIITNAANIKSGNKMNEERARAIIATSEKNKKFRDLEEQQKPYPQEDIVKREDTEEDFKQQINNEYKSDKYDTIPQDIKQKGYDAHRKLVEITNKYGYYPKSIKELKADPVIALSIYLRATGAKKVETRTDRIKAAEKVVDDTVKSINEIYNREFPEKARAVPEKKIGDPESAYYKEGLPTYNIEQFRENPNILKSDEAYNSLKYPNSFVSLYTDRNLVASENNVSPESIEVGDEVFVSGKKYAVESMLEIKKGKETLKLLRLDEKGNILRQRDLPKEEMEVSEEIEEEVVEEPELPAAPEKTQDEVAKEQTKETDLLLGGQAEQRRKDGKYTKDGVEYVRNPKGQGIASEMTGEVRFTNEVSLPFKYKLVEAETLQPSHQDGIRNPLHFIPEAQPKNRNDVGSLQAEESFANNPRFSELGENTNAYSGAPVVNERGEVVQGNNRSAGLRKGYQRNNPQYKNDLAANAEQFGFTREQVEGMKNPVLVREVAVSDQGAVELGNYDAKDLETGGKRRIDPIAVTRRMPFDVKGRIADLFTGEETLNQAIRANQKRLLELLNPYLNQAQRNTITKDGVLTDAGIKDLEAVVQQFLFDNGDTALPDLFESLSATQKEGLRKSLPYVFSVSPEKSLVPDIQEAILAVNDFNASGAGEFDAWLLQGDIFNDGKTPKDKYTPLELAIAKTLVESKTQKEVARKFADYADVVKDKEADMFEPARPGKSRKEGVLEIFKAEDYAKPISERGRKEAAPEKKPTPEPSAEKRARETKREPRLPETEKRAEARKELRDAFNDLMNLGVAYDPRSQAEKQVRLTKAIINVIKQEAIGAIKDLQKYIKDNLGFDISDKDAKYLLIESKKPEYAIQEPTAGKVPVQPKARAGEKVEAGVPPARPPKAPKEEGEAEGRKEERRFSKTLIESPELLKAVKKGVGATLEYTRQANAMSVAQAQEILDVLGEDKAYNAIKDEQTNGAVRTVLGQVLIKRYNELAKKATSKDDRDSYINNTIDIAEYVTKKLATDAGQTIQAFKLWQALTPEAQLLAAVKEVKKSARANVGKVRKDIDNLGKKFNKANEEAIKEILKSEEVDRSVKKDAQEGVQKAKDRAAKARQKRADIIKKYKGKGGITLTTGGLTKEGIEFVGEVAVTYIEEGLAEVQVIAEKILADIKTITGSSPNDKVKQEVFEIAEKELSKSDLKIVKSVKDQRLKINEIAIKHFTEAEKIKKNLAQKFMDEADMSESNAEALAKRFEDAFDRVVSRKKAEILAKSKKRFDRIQKAINEQAGKKAENKTLQDEIIKYSNLGAFKADDMLDYLAKKFNLGQLTTEQAAKIEELAQKIQKAPEGTPKREATEDLLAYQANLNKGNWGEVAQAIWYANILSGYRTHEKNIVSTFFNSLAELGTEIIADPKSAPYLIAGYIEGFKKRGLLEAGRTLATGRSPIHVSKIETPEPLERVKFIRGGYNPANWFKYVGRAMKAEDVLSFQGLKEARAWQLARKEAEKYGFNTWTKSGWKKVNELLMNTTERFEIARDQALEEGLVENSRDYKRRIYELMENSRPEAMTEDAYNFAAHGTYNYMSDGTLGAFTNAISNALDVKIGGVQPGRFVVPFTRIITNVVNNALDYSPVGVIRAAKGARGFKSFDEFSLTKGSYKPLTPEQRRIVAIKAAVGISFAAIIQYMVSAGLIDMSGEGPEDEKKKAQLREQGWQPYSIKIGDTWYSYFYTPLVLTLGWMGNLNDAAKYGEEDEQTLLRRASIASLKFGGMIADMTWINSAATFLGALNEPKINEQQRRVENALSGMARGFVPFAQNITQLTQAYNSTFQIPAKQVNNSWEALYQDIPIARNSLNDKVNALGEPVIKDIDIMWSKEKGSPVWSFLTDKKGWVATLDRKTVLVFDQKLRQDRPLTDDEFYELSKLRGRYIKEDIERIMKEGYPVKREGAIKIVLGEDMTPKELNNILSKRIEPLATKKAKAKIFGFEYSEKEADELNAELTELEREYWGLNEN